MHTDKNRCPEQIKRLPNSECEVNKSDAECIFRDASVKEVVMRDAGWVMLFRERLISRSRITSPNFPPGELHHCSEARVSSRHSER
jgi:hypothetical protein